MLKLYILNIRWVKTPSDTVAIDNLLVDSDWLRFNGYTWLVWTAMDAAAISKLVREKVSHSEDSVMVIKADPNDYWGWAPKFVWDWLQTKRTMALPYRL